MIRTTLSFCALFGALLLGSKLLQESSRPQPSEKHLAPARSPAESQEPAATPAVHAAETSIKADVSASASIPLHFVSYEEDLTEKVGSNTSEGIPAELNFDSDAAERPIKSLEELLLEDVLPRDKPQDKSAEVNSAETDPSDDPAGPDRK